MRKILLTVGVVENIDGTMAFIKLLGRETFSSKYGEFDKYDVKLSKGRNSFKFEYSDSISNYKNNIRPDLNDIMYCLINDYNTIENVGFTDNDEVEQYLIDNFDYTDVKEIKRIRKALIHNYEGIKRVFKDEEIEYLVNKYENY